MSILTTHFSKIEKPYTGQELRPHFLLTEFGLKGAALAAFIGPCHVQTEHLVDWEDRLAHDRIEAKSMIHFIGEFFGYQLREGVLIQRFLMAQMGEILNSFNQGRFTRVGDDLFCQEKKLSVSIVTASPVSILLHSGINLDPAGAPVPAIGLEKIGIEAERFIPTVLATFAREWTEMEWACAKVRPVI